MDFTFLCICLVLKLGSICDVNTSTPIFTVNLFRSFYRAEPNEVLSLLSFSILKNSVSDTNRHSSIGTGSHNKLNKIK